MGWLYSVDQWFLCRQYTVCHPARVRYPLRPLRIGTGPSTTFLPFCTQVTCRLRSTQATRYLRTGHFLAALGFFRAEMSIICAQVTGPANPLAGLILCFFWKARTALQSFADCFPSTFSFSHRSTCRWYGPGCLLHVTFATTSPIGTYSMRSYVPGAASRGSTASSLALGGSPFGGSIWSGVSICRGGAGPGPPPGTNAGGGRGAGGGGVDAQLVA